MDHMQGYHHQSLILFGHPAFIRRRRFRRLWIVRTRCVSTLSDALGIVEGSILSGERLCACSRRMRGKPMRSAIEHVILPCLIHHIAHVLSTGRTKHWIHRYAVIP